MTSAQPPHLRHRRQSAGRWSANPSVQSALRRDRRLASTTAIPTTGGTLAGYRIDELIAVRGSTMVYRAQQLSLGRPVALTILAPQVSHDESFRQRFRRDGQRIARLNHPNIVTIYDSGEADGLLYTAMRLVEGTTVAQRIGDRASRQRRQLPSWSRSPPRLTPPTRLASSMVA